jgi:cold shock CspA family protein/ferric iron reductase protein FhuF
MIKNEDWKIGHVKVFNNDRGFGFLKCWDDRQEYFVHISKVKTEPIEENDYVVFRLGPSRKKPGTFEALYVCLVSNFSQDPPFLQEQYLKYQIEKFRRHVIQSLTFREIINLLKTEITSFESIKNEEQFFSFRKLANFYTSLYDDQASKKTIASVISDRVKEIATNNYQVKFWIEGLFSEQPGQKLIKDYFYNSKREEQFAILKKVDYPFKEKLIKELLLKDEPIKVLEFVLAHLKKVNDIDNNLNLKSKIYDREFWSDKIDFGLLETAINQFQEQLDDRQLLSLFLNGYLTSINPDYVLSKYQELSLAEIEQILEKEGLSEDQSFNLVYKILQYEVNFYPRSKKSFDSELNRNIFSKRFRKNIRSDTDPFQWILTISKNLSESYSSKIEKNLIEQVDEMALIDLWENGYLQNLPDNIISNYLKKNENIEDQVKKWIRQNNIDRKKIVNILESNVYNQSEIHKRSQFYVLYNHLQALAELDIDVTSIEGKIPPQNIWFFKLFLWLTGKSNKFNFEKFRDKLVFLSSSDQIQFLRKLFSLAHTGEFDLTVNKLSQLTRINLDIYSLNEKFNDDIPLDISVDIVIEAIKSFSEKGKFLFDGELVSIALKNLAINRKYKFKVSELFEKCPGRYEASFNWDSNGEIRKVQFGNNQYYYAIEFSPGEYEHVNTYRGGYERFVRNENFEALKEAVKQLPGRKWNPEEKHWGVPSKYHEQVMQFASENRFFLNLEGSNYKNNTHLAEFKREEVPSGIKFCEGRLSKNKDRMFNRDFWWCCNQPCFSNSETIHSAENWHEYTLLDFLNIFGFNLDDVNRSGDYIDKGKYYQFISTINRFNRLLERMYCEDCGDILFPVDDSHYAHYRVVRFHCENKECSQLHKEIYLHHCLNGKCNGIIDSRKSKKCPNGLYICSNVECGCCCSHDMMKRRMENLKYTGGYISEKLRHAVDNKLGHLERGEHFCYKCGAFMNEVKTDVFKCQNCQIKYDVSKNKFKRPNRHMRQRPDSTPTNLPPDNYGEDNNPF